MKAINYSIVTMNFNTNKDGLVPVRLKFYLNNELVTLKTGEWVEPKIDENETALQGKKVFLNPFAGIKRGSHNDTILQRVKALTDKIGQYNEEIYNSGKTPSIDEIKARLKGGTTEDVMTVLKLYAEYKPILFKSISESTQEQYDHVFKLLVEFLKEKKNKKTDYNLKDLKKGFLPEFAYYLLAKEMKLKTVLG